MTDPKALASSNAPIIADFMRPLRSLVVAVLGTDGQLIDANRGFLELFPEQVGTDVTPAQIRTVFLNPTLDEILERASAGEDTTVCSGRLTLGDPDGESESWLGEIFRLGDALLVVCESDIDEERRLRHELLELTEDYARQQRELARAHQELERRAARFEQDALTDALTGLPNRRHFDALIHHRREEAQRYGESLSVIMLDIDRFKFVNDTWGHPAGDKLLQECAGILQANARAADVVGRLGGEEFAVLAPSTDASGGRELAERLRRGVEQLEPSNGLPRITVSAGVAVMQDEESVEDLLARADKALYQAKQDGRNRMVVADPDQCTGGR